MKPKKNSTKSATAKKPVARKRKAVAKATSKEKKLLFIDGKTAEATDDKARLRDLEKLLNPSALHNPFKVTSAEDLDKKLADMSLPELQSLSVEVGVFPSGSKTTLKNKLKKEFKNRMFLGKGRVITTNHPVSDYSSLSEEEKKLFSTD
jgi:hypothetical protein